MAIAPGTYNLGPSNGKVFLKTGVEGPGAKMAHSLVIEVTNWTCKATYAEDASASSFMFHCELPDFEIREGHGGMKPLSDRDREEIKKSIHSKILGTGRITFTSTAVEVNGDSATVTGNLEINGKTASQTFTLTESGGTLTGRATVTQTRYDIKPFKGPLGAFRLKDDVQVEFSGTL